jgi:hypothetical protein
MFREAYGIVTCKVIVMVKEVKLLRSTPWRYIWALDV